jgi:atypical dual specificity phosphatase
LGTLIEIEDVSLGFERHGVLHGVTVDVPRTGVTAIMGPSGTGKSTLLRTLARWNEALPSFWMTGEVRLEGRDLMEDIPLEEAQRLAPMLKQKASLYTASVLENAISEIRGDGFISAEDKLDMAGLVFRPLGLWDEYEKLLERPVLDLSICQQRKLSIARLISGGARCLLVDEPFRDLPEDELVGLRSLLERWAQDNAIVLVSHHQGRVKEIANQVVLIAAGRVVESGEAQDFFRRPRTELGESFLRNGNCWPESIEDTADAEIPETGKQAFPGGFHWIVPGLLGGMQQPGLLRDEAEDLAALHRLGCRRLLTLTEAPYNSMALARLGIEGRHFPVADMGVPSVSAAHTLVTEILAWLDSGICTVVHCKAGLGRTGTMLACVEVGKGQSAVKAIERVRSINPYYIQSRSQLNFISRYESYARSHGRAAQMSHP